MSTSRVARSQSCASAIHLFFNLASYSTRCVPLIKFSTSYVRCTFARKSLVQNHRWTYRTYPVDPDRALAPPRGEQRLHLVPNRPGRKSDGILQIQTLVTKFKLQNNHRYVDVSTADCKNIFRFWLSTTQAHSQI
jgi:hypothetical protein